MTPAEGASPQDTSLEESALKLMVHALTAEASQIRLRVSGSSMMPTLRDADIVTVDPMPDGGALPGSLVLAIRVSGENAPDHLVCHRLVALEPDGRITLGSDRWGSFETLERDQVVGVISSAIRGRNGRCVYRHQSPMGGRLDRLQAAWLRVVRLLQRQSQGTRTARLAHLLYRVLAWLRASITSATSRLA